MATRCLSIYYIPLMSSLFSLLMTCLALLYNMWPPRLCSLAIKLQDIFHLFLPNPETGKKHTSFIQEYIFHLQRRNSQNKAGPHSLTDSVSPLLQGVQIWARNFSSPGQGTAVSQNGEKKGKEEGYLGKCLPEESKF